MGRRNRGRRNRKDNTWQETHPLHFSNDLDKHLAGESISKRTPEQQCEFDKVVEDALKMRKRDSERIQRAIMLGERKTHKQNEENMRKKLERRRQRGLSIFREKLPRLGMSRKPKDMVELLRLMELVNPSLDVYRTDDPKKSALRRNETITTLFSRMIDAKDGCLFVKSFIDFLLIPSLGIIDYLRCPNILTVMGCSREQIENTKRGEFRIVCSQLRKKLKMMISCSRQRDLVVQIFIHSVKPDILCNILSQDQILQVMGIVEVNVSAAIISKTLSTEILQSLPGGLIFKILQRLHYPVGEDSITAARATMVHTSTLIPVGSSQLRHGLKLNGGIIPANAEIKRGAKGLMSIQVYHTHEAEPEPEPSAIEPVTELATCFLEISVIEDIKKATGVKHNHPMYDSCAFKLPDDALHPTAYCFKIKRKYLHINFKDESDLRWNNWRNSSYNHCGENGTVPEFRLGSLVEIDPDEYVWVSFSDYSRFFFNDNQTFSDQRLNYLSIL